MKKYFLMLVVALVMPLVFTSCGDDDPKTDEPSQFPYSLPVLNWGVSQTSVKSSMANSGYELTLEETGALVYSLNGNLPMYTYIFSDDKLITSSLTLSDTQDTQYDFQGFLEGKYGKAKDEDDAFWYYDAGNCIVAYGYTEEIDGWMATWVPKPDNTRAVDFSEVAEAAKANLELVKKARNQK